MVVGFTRTVSAFSPESLRRTRSGDPSNALLALSRPVYLTIKAFRFVIRNDIRLLFHVRLQYVRYSC